MFFDRNEIHIQAFVDFINGKLIIFRSSSSQYIFIHDILKIRQLIQQEKVTKMIMAIFGPNMVEMYSNDIFDSLIDFSASF